MKTTLLLFAIIIGLVRCDMTAHVEVSERFIADIKVENNKYKSPASVVWNGTNSYVEAHCASWNSLLLQRTYGWTQDQFKDIFGDKSPYSVEYHGYITSRKMFYQVEKVTDVKRGDIVAMVYYPVGSPTGHIMVVRYAPELMTSKNPIVEGTKQYSVWITDMTGSYHNVGDTREPPKGSGEGVGSGQFRLYADEMTNKIVGYTWSLKSSTYYPKKSSNGRDVVVGRLDQNAIAARGFNVLPVVPLNASSNTTPMTSPPGMSSSTTVNSIPFALLFMLMLTLFL